MHILFSINKVYHQLVVLGGILIHKLFREPPPRLGQESLSFLGTKT